MTCATTLCSHTDTSARALQVVEAQCQQLRTLNTNARYLSATQAQYTRALLATFPPQLCKLLFCNSGSEANDVALQIARAAAPEARHVAVMEGAYHGHVASMLELSPYKFWGPQKHGLRANMRRPPHVHVLPLPDVARCGSLSSECGAVVRGFGMPALQRSHCCRKCGSQCVVAAQLMTLPRDMACKNTVQFWPLTSAGCEPLRRSNLLRAGSGTWTAPRRLPQRCVLPRPQAAASAPSSARARYPALARSCYQRGTWRQRSG